MPINSREKGRRGELEVAEILRHHGIPARRGVQYEGGAGSPDIKHALDAIVHLEVKCVSRMELDDWYDQAAVDSVYRVPVVVHRIATRKLSTPWRVSLSAAHLAMLYGYEQWGALEHGTQDGIGDHALALPVSARIVRAQALRYEREMGAAAALATPDRPAVLLHSRVEHDALWMASMSLVEFLTRVLLPHAQREYGYEPRQASGYPPELEREYDAFWQERRERLAKNLPLFKAAA